MAKQIELTQGYFATVDEADFDELSTYHWIIMKVGKQRYATRGVSVADGVGINKKMLMHRQIMNANDPLMLIDHIDGDGLNNQRSNLRFATKAQNLRNMGLSAHNTSGFKGVSFDKSRQLWVARISVGNRGRTVGRYATAIEAAKAYNEAAIALSGDFAFLNTFHQETTNAEQVSKPVRSREERLQASRKQAVSRTATKRRN